MSLLQFLDRVECDVVTVDDERCIARVKNITSKRITQAVLSSVIEGVVTHSVGAINEINIFAFAKHRLITAVDKVTWKGNVVPSDSAEAKRRKRDDVEVRHGETTLIDDVTMQCIDAYWQALVCRKELTVKADVEKITVSDHVAPSTPSIPSPPSPPSSPLETKALEPIVEEAILPMVIVEPVHIKPKSSISKKQAFAILEVVSHFLATHAKPTGEQCLALARQRWPTAGAGPCKQKKGRVRRG